MSAKGRKPDAKELAEQLRANLRRRKEQLRARKEGGGKRRTANGEKPSQ